MLLRHNKTIGVSLKKQNTHMSEQLLTRKASDFYLIVQVKERVTQ